MRGLLPAALLPITSTRRAVLRRMPCWKAGPPSASRCGAKVLPARSASMRCVRCAARCSRPRVCNGRAVIFYGAQKMNASSANALLKVLEEPPEGVLFVLTATSAAAVLPTIRSRCAIYPIAPVTPAGMCELAARELPGL